MFKIKPFEARTLTWWYSQRENIDLEPGYQRGGKVWDKVDKAYLIDSIINEFDIPKFYLADFTYVSTPLNEKNKAYAVIDGRQRFEAIFDFFEGNITLDAKFEYLANKNLNLAGLGYKDLKAKHPKIADIIDNFGLTVMSVITDEEGKINDLFVRLNHSKPLTGAELRNARLGIVPKLIRKIAEHSFFRTRIAFAVKRKQDQNVAAKLLLIEYRGGFVDTKKRHLDQFVVEGIESVGVGSFERAAERVLSILNQMTHVFLKNDTLLKSEGPLTLYYWFVRSQPQSEHAHIREFLWKFEVARQKNRQRAKEKRGNVDEQLLSFDILNRSTNDQSSLADRFSILQERFALFRVTGTVTTP